MSAIPCPVCGNLRKVEQICSSDGWHNPPCWSCGDPGWINPLNAQDPLPGGPVKAITLWQPWATLMALGSKRNETRSWATSHRGPLAIHAAKHLHGRIGDQLVFRADPYSVPIIATRVRDGIELSRSGHPSSLLPLGAVVAIVSLIDVKSTSSSELAPDPLEAALGDYSAGRFAWQTGSLFVPPVPIPARGAQGLWEWTPPSGLLYYGRTLT